jgi:hypothetical protein
MPKSLEHVFTSLWSYGTQKTSKRKPIFFFLEYNYPEEETESPPLSAPENPTFSSLPLLKGPSMARGGWIAYLKIYKPLEQLN